MAVDIEQLKKLREETGAGIADCRSALEEARGDFEKAKEIIRQKGLDKAASKAERDVKAGVVEAYIHSGNKIGAIVSLACETDFVARTDEFKHLVHEIAMQIASMDPESAEDLLKQPYIRDNSITIEELIKQEVAKLGENIQVLSFSRHQVGK